jgi:hypothetical protein
MSAEPTLIQATLGRIAREVELRDRFASDPQATLAELGLDEAARASMLRHGPERLLAYHAMVHSRLRGTIQTFLGPAADCLGRARLSVDVDAWIAEAGPRTPYLRDIPSEFLSWVRPRWDADEGVSGWVIELADHQVLIRSIRNDPRELGPATGLGLELDRPIACNPTLRMVEYRWPVHRLPKSLSPGSVAPDEAPTIVIGYRGRDEQPTFVDIKPRSAKMLELLIAGKTLREALFGACEALGETLDDSVLSIAAVTLADLLDRDVLLGGAPS